MRGYVRTDGNDAYLEISGGREVVFDIEDLPRVRQHSWYYSPPNGRRTKGYAHTTLHGRTVYLHRFIMNAERGEEIDHRDRNGLNDRKSNLRRVTHSQNLHNQLHAQKGSKSGVLGVNPQNTPEGMRYFGVVEKDGRAKKKRFPYTPDGLEEAKRWVESVRVIALTDPNLWSRLFRAKS